MSNVVFILGDKLPLISEAVIAILSQAPGGSPHIEKETTLRRNAINSYVTALIKLWSKAFGAEYIQARRIVGKKLRKRLATYFNEVSCSKKQSSKRERIREWRSKSENNELFDILKASCNPEEFQTEEREFYYGQKCENHYGYISEVIDFEYEERKFSERANEESEAAAQAEEMAFIEGDDMSCEVLESSDMDTSLNVSVNRSGTVRVSIPMEDQGSQTDTINIERPRIRKKRNFTDEIKATCAKVSTDCGISVDKARVAVKTVCKSLYDHDYYLTRQEQMENEQTQCEETKNSVQEIEIEMNDEDVPMEPERKRSRTFQNTAKEYEDYNYVLPSRPIIVKYKELQATQEERDAALALYQKPDDVVVTLHYDTTTRNSIDGEWPSLVLAFSNQLRFRLRPIFFAYEDRKNIADLIVETYSRLAACASIHLEIDIDPKYLWENSNNFMTDSVSKNLKVEELVADILKTAYKPRHLLCKSHTVEKLDSSNIDVLSEIENKVHLREKLVSINPSLRPFFRGKKAVVVCGITAILKLVTHDKSANSSSLADQFDLIVEREGQTKHMALYHERRFTKLGYSAASIVHALPLLEMLLRETEKSNLLVEACKLYLESEFFITKLKLLAYFTYKVTLPLLYCVEISNQEKLLDILPRLHDDLKAGDMNTLQDFIIQYRHVPVQEPVSQLEKEVLYLMCVDAAAGIQMQCGREYGFAKEGEDPRATELHKLSVDELFGMPTNNLICERDLGKFSHLAIVAKFRNKSFKAKGIRTDMTLYQAHQNVVEDVTRKIQKVLEEREEAWTKKQKNLHRQRIELKMSRARKEHNYIRVLLEKCKSWGGPCTTINQLETVMKKNSDKLEKIVKTELSYYCTTDFS